MQWSTYYKSSTVRSIDLNYELMVLYYRYFIVQRHVFRQATAAKNLESKKSGIRFFFVEKVITLK